jgi:hypothetical protein
MRMPGFTANTAIDVTPGPVAGLLGSFRAGGTGAGIVVYQTVARVSGPAARGNGSGPGHVLCDCVPCCKATTTCIGDYCITETECSDCACHANCQSPD